MRASLLLSALVIVACPLLAAEPKPDPEGIEFYEKHVRPLFVAKCYDCHSATAKKLKGELRLDSKAAWLKGGASGPLLVPGEPDKSNLMHAIRRNHKDIAAMPPDKPLTKEETALLVEWVQRGGPAPEAVVAFEKPAIDIVAAQKRWPFTPVPRIVLAPDVKDATWPRNNIDRFILAALEAKKLKPLGDTDQRTLIRRATYDLHGLPPTTAEVDAFLKDDSPEAFAKVVDRLLASPHYGERWGRHWLDVVRYADTAGDNSDYPIPQQYRYRNWVIDAINKDMPYDQFIREQLAGDLLGGDIDERQQRVIATGYLANARRFGSRVDDYPQHLTIEDTLDNLGRAFLGLTLNCARCHDHKFDPLTMHDYYALYGIFNSTRYPWPGIELDKRQRDFVPLALTEEVAAELQKRAAQEQLLTNDIKRLEQLKKNETDKAKQDAINKDLQAKQMERDRLRQRPLPFPLAYAMAEGKKIGDAHVQLKGDPGKPGVKVPRGFPAVLGGFTLKPDDKSSGRLALANWIADAKNPLTARVMVNRVWQHHFGRGLVPTPNDFGKQGQAPTHPELLDHLANLFVMSGWSLKSLHRELMLSRVYQLTTVGEQPVASKDVDVNNDLLWKFRRQRLDAESIRDGMLAVSGLLDRRPGGEHPFPPPYTWDFTQHKPFRAVYESNKRSVYLMTQRIQRHPYLAIFDGPDTGASTANRITSTTTLQSLYLLNDAFVHTQAKALSAHLLKQHDTDAARIAEVYQRLFARPPSDAERERGEAYLQKAAAFAPEGTPKTTFAWESYTRTLLRLNEFVYVN